MKWKVDLYKLNTEPCNIQLSIMKIIMYGQNEYDVGVWSDTVQDVYIILATVSRVYKAKWTVDI